jgi:hypothetical protein
MRKWRVPQRGLKRFRKSLKEIRQQVTKARSQWQQVEVQMQAFAFTRPQALAAIYNLTGQDAGALRSRAVAR